eukprot:1158898-Pelagomonas_calceolata.AAC.5
MTLLLLDHKFAHPASLIAYFAREHSSTSQHWFIDWHPPSTYLLSLPLAQGAGWEAKASILLVSPFPGLKPAQHLTSNTLERSFPVKPGDTTPYKEHFGGHRPSPVCFLDALTRTFP